MALLTNILSGNKQLLGLQIDLRCTMDDGTRGVSGETLAREKKKRTLLTEEAKKAKRESESELKAQEGAVVSNPPMTPYHCNLRGLKPDVNTAFFLSDQPVTKTCQLDRLFTFHSRDVRAFCLNWDFYSKEAGNQRNQHVC